MRDAIARYDGAGDAVGTVNSRNGRAVLPTADPEAAVAEA